MTPQILLVADEQPIYQDLKQAVKAWGYVLSKSHTRDFALELFETINPDVTIIDNSLTESTGLEILTEIKARNSDALVIVITDDLPDYKTHTAIRIATDYLTRSFTLEDIHTSIIKTLKSRQMSDAVQDKSHEEPKDYYFEQIIGESVAIKETVWLARKVAESDVSCVLLQGESGTGKDLFAKAIHYSSPRAQKPFVAINCAAIPANLLESELFGHEKGAFTDAKLRKPGLFEQASDGTLFLDEIGELEIGLQAKLLRVLEERSFRRVGGIQDLPLNVRVIAASNRDLKYESDEHRFRKDLFFRLSIMYIELPSLRDRGEDVILLAEHFLSKLDTKTSSISKRRFSVEVIEAFHHHSWEGNIRELRNLIERSVILEEGNVITMKFMPDELHPSCKGHLATSDKHLMNNHFSVPADGVSLDAVEKWLVEEALRINNGNVTRASAFLSIPRDRLRYYLKKMKLSNKL
jgi:two-component system, NtrC family, response regulator AtoC